MKGKKSDKENMKMKKDIYNAILKIMLLRSIKCKENYSYQLFKNIKNSPIKIEKPDMKNDVYNTLASLLGSGYIKTFSKIENGKLKNYYRITDKGIAALDEIKPVFKDVFKRVSKLLD